MHTSFRKGTPVFYILKDGTIGCGKFKDKKAGFVHLDDGRIRIRDIRAMTIRKMHGDLHRRHK